MKNARRAKKRLGPLLLFMMTLTSGPAFAQVDLSGEWSDNRHEDQPHRGPGPDLGDYTGLPINDAARLKAESWDASILTLPEHQCKPHPSTYALRGPQDLRIWKEVGTATQQVIAWRTHGSWMAPERVIYMDGRPHPPEYAAHTWMGFSTGKWEGNLLTVTTTHLKVGWIQRNGIAHSDKATMTEHYVRHGDYLTVVTMVDDPVYLTEPFIRTTNWVLDLGQEITAYPCHIVVEVDRPKGSVPHHLPGTNTFLAEYASRYGVPAEAAKGGAETMYPEYMLKLKNPSESSIGRDPAARNASAR